MKDNKMQFTQDAKEIKITIPISLLKFAAENHPETPLKIRDKQEFAKQMIFQLQNKNSESGLSEFEELLDKTMTEIAESGHRCVEVKELEY